MTSIVAFPVDNKGVDSSVEDIKGLKGIRGGFYQVAVCRSRRGTSPTR